MPPSGHSSGSHSSRPVSGGSFRSPGVSRSGPSAHSGSSRRGRPSFSNIRPAHGSSSGKISAPPPRTIPRPRVNQPVGFLLSGLLRPTNYYGRRHDYVYYPESWTDSGSGTRYEKGYYDENGKHYDSVSFRKDGRYDNVVCHCDYCNTDSVLTLDNDSGGTQNLVCPNCGAPMTIKTALDEIVAQGDDDSDPAEDTVEAAHGLSEQGQPKKKSLLGLIVFVAAALVLMNLFGRAQNSYSIPVYHVQEPGEPAVGAAAATLYLKSVGAGRYTQTDRADSDKTLVWDAAEDSYYDAESDCWLWYNTDVAPAQWQYWYEGISSDFGDYGWMEHDSDGWWIEASAGSWIRLPSEYDTAALWYIG